jgi:hypothetical protein
LIGRADEFILDVIIRKILSSKTFLANQVWFVMLDLLSMKGIIFEIAVQVVFCQINRVFFTAIATITRYILG